MVRGGHGPGDPHEHRSGARGRGVVGIQFAVGTSLRRTPTSALVDGGVELPDATRRYFTLHGDRWETPGPDDAEALVERLVRSGAVECDPLVAAALRGCGVPGSDRTVERRFRAATGLTRGAVDRIARARAATTLLLGGETAAAVVAELGYYDEPHLARALRRYVGRTAGQLRSGTGGALALSAQRTTTQRTTS